MALSGTSHPQRIEKENEDEERALKIAKTS
jgi:hypothetical protein